LGSGNILVVAVVLVATVGKVVYVSISPLVTFTGSAIWLREDPPASFELPVPAANPAAVCGMLHGDAAGSCADRERLCKGFNRTIGLVELRACSGWTNPDSVDGTDDVEGLVADVRVGVDAATTGGIGTERDFERTSESSLRRAWDVDF